MRTNLLALGLAASITLPLTGQSTPPPGSAAHSLVYHDSLGAVLLVNAGLGSMQQPPSSTPTRIWKWDGRVWALIDSAGPPVRNLGGVAYDITRNVVVLHGGTYGDGLSYGDTWEWHPRRGWLRITGPGPGTRDHVQMAYDATRKEIVLFGGQARLDSFPSDTWLYRGGVWRRVVAPGPAGRAHYNMTFDRVSGRVLLHGGTSPTLHQKFGDSWSWSGTAWEPAAAPVMPRTHSAMAQSSNGVMVVGGFTDSPNDVLVLRNGEWSAVANSGLPSGRYLTAMAYDPIRQVTVLFGGGSQSAHDLFADTWEYSTRGGWQEIRPPR